MLSRTRNYIIVFCLVFAFTASIYNIKVVNKKVEESKKKRLEESEEKKGEKSEEKKTELFFLDKNARFILPTLAMASFFIGCYYISIIIIEGEATGRDKYSGIIFMLVIGIILLVMNATILNESSITSYIKGKKFSIVGMMMALGVSAIVFGFLDNFGMKLGTDALDDTFLQTFLSPFSKDNRFKPYQKNISKNLQIMNKWVSGDWRKVINHTLRFENEINKNSKMKDLSNAIKSFDGTRLIVPTPILKSRSVTNDYVDNIREKYDIIDGSKAMLGNTFSDFIGALLGAGIINLFIYMTSYDGVYTGDDKIDNSSFITQLNNYAPIAEAFFIALGCLVPVFLNIAMTRSGENNNNFYSWIIVGGIALLIIIMMYFSVKGIKQMTTADKKHSIKKTMKSMKDRIDLDSKYGEEESELLEKFDKFVENL